MWDGASASKVAKVGNKRSVHTKSVGVGISPVKTLKTLKAARLAVPERMFCHPGLLRDQIESLCKEVAHLKDKCRSLKKKISLEKRDCAGKTRNKATQSCEDDGFAPLTRREWKQLADNVDAAKRKKCRRKADPSGSTPQDSVTDRESDAATVIDLHLVCDQATE